MTAPTYTLSGGVKHLQSLFTEADRRKRTGDDVHRERIRMKHVLFLKAVIPQFIIHYLERGKVKGVFKTVATFMYCIQHQ